ncbi:DUF3944 domain-containing protein [Helicobacter bilis]|nr:DUF3944 domain-containing protein [Helicobacter bilis]
MAYKKDSDLEFLREIPSEELDVLVELLTKDTDGKTRHAESLTGKDSYKKHYPNHHEYIDDIIEELQTFGGHTIVNKIRGGGVLYKEILCDVCDKQKVDYSKDSNIIAIEKALITKMFKDLTESLAKEDPKKLEEAMKEVKPESTNGLYMYQLSTIVTSAAMQTFGMTTAAGAAAFASFGATLGIGKVVGLINPILTGATTLWLMSDLMGPAYRVTTPATLQIAFLRQRHLHRKEIEELETNHKEIMESLETISDDLEEEQKIALATKIMGQLKVKLNILVVGATGVGKSSTIAAIFKNGKNFVKIGTDSKPQTQNIEKFVISNNITLWDSPGLGEGEEKDKKHKDNIIAKLQEKDKDGNALIDLVLVILDATNKDLETAYKLINKVIIPNMPNKDRILIALNKCDCVIDRVDFVENGRKLTDEQIQYLDSKVNDIQERVKKDTGVDVEPIYYSAGLKKENKLQEMPYNITKLLYFITKKTPPIKRLVYIGQDNKEKGTDDGKKDYEKSWWKSTWEFATDLAKENKDTAKQMISDYALPFVKNPAIRKILDSLLKKL